MINKKGIIISLIFILINLAGTYLSVNGQEVSAVAALRLFDRGNYEEAEQIFNQLLNEDPDNTMLNYYYGACRTENGHYSKNDLNYLLKAGKTVTPHRINYYLGIQYHASNDWEQALKYYNLFSVSVPENEQQELNINGKIQQCYDKVNPFKTTDSDSLTGTSSDSELSNKVGGLGQPASDHSQSTVQTPRANETQPEKRESVAITTDKEQESTSADQSGIPSSELNQENTEISQTTTTDQQNSPKEPSSGHVNDKDSRLGISRRSLPDLPGVKPTITLPEGEFIEFQINNTITYLHTSHFRTDKGEELFKQANSMQKNLEKKLENAEMLRKEYRQTDDNNMKATIGQEILTIENETYGMQDIISRLHRECREAENEYWQKADATEVNNFTVELKKIKALKEGSYSEAMATDTKNDEPIVIIDPSELLLTPGINAGGTKTPELVYKIQIGAYSRGVPAHIKRLYNKLEMLRKIDNYTDENGVVVYTTGNLTNLEDAMTMRDQVRQEGIKDAHVVPYFQGKRITLEQAKEIEKGR